jgi:hypothetical protein
MRHFLVMTAFAGLAAVVFGIVAKDSRKDRVIGLALGWILYFIPF